MVSVELENRSSDPVAVQFAPVDQNLTWADVSGIDDASAMFEEGSVPTAAVAAPGGSHATAVEPFWAGRWLVTCRHERTGVAQPMGIVVAEDVSGPVTGEATVTATDAPSRRRRPGRPHERVG